MSERDEGPAPADRPPDGAPSPEPQPAPEWPPAPEPGAPPEWPAAPDPASQPPYGGPPTGYGQPPGYGAPPYPPGYGAPPPPPGPGPIHPLTVGRAFSVGWSLFRFRWKALIGVMVLFLIPAHALNALWYLAYGAALAELYLSFDPRPFGPPLTLADLPPLPPETFPLLILSSLLVGVVSLLGTAAVLYVLGWTYGGGWRSWRQAVSAAFGRLLSLLGVTLLIFLVVIAIIAVAALLIASAVAVMQGGLGVFVGLLIGVSAFAAVLFVVIRWAFSVNAIMLEGAGAVAALGRSWRLVSGSTWRVLGYALLIGLVLFLLGLVVALLQILLFGLGVDFMTGQPEPFNATRVIGQLVLQGIFSILVTPWTMAVMLLLYYDLRLRQGETLTPPPA